MLGALTPFENATLEQLVSFKAKNESDIERLMLSAALHKQAKALVIKWNKNRQQIGLKPWDEQLNEKQINRLE